MNVRCVMGYGCTMCDALYRSEVAADACCRCSECGTKTKGCVVVLKDACGHCEHVRRVGWERAEVKNRSQALVEAKRDLGRTLARKRPAKGAPRE